MVVIDAKIEGLPETLGMLDHLDEGLRDRTPFHKQAGVQVIAASQHQFLSGGDPKWEPLSDVTVALRRKGKGSNTPQPLRDTGQLMASIGVLSKDGIYEIDPTGIVIGTNRKGAAMLHEGGRSKGFIKGSRIPPRPFLVLKDKDRKIILRLAEDFVARRMKEAKA